MRHLAAFLSRHTGEEESVATSNLYQKLSVHLMNMISTFPDSQIDRTA